MERSLPQRVITISVVGNEENAAVYYSYVSPVTGLVYINAPVCDILVDRPICTLYTLDYSSCFNGWTVTEISPHDESPPLKWVPGAKDLSIMTVNPHKTHDKYNYYIHYKNSLTGAIMKRDPQEENVPPTEPHYEK
jgi:hypothetical protein